MVLFRAFSLSMATLGLCVALILPQALGASNGFLDYYEVLGVAPSATEEEIKTAYRRAVKRTHPDSNAGDTSKVEEYRQVNEAYEVLNRANSRAEYDRLGQRGSRPTTGNPMRRYGVKSSEYIVSELARRSQGLSVDELTDLALKLLAQEIAIADQEVAKGEVLRLSGLNLAINIAYEIWFEKGDAIKFNQGLSRVMEASQKACFLFMKSFVDRNQREVHDAYQLGYDRMKSDWRIAEGWPTSENLGYRQAKQRTILFAEEFASREWAPPRSADGGPGRKCASALKAGL
jgi:curved DNA-binding protein CbpA